MERGKALQVTCFSGMRPFRSRVHRDRKGRIISRGADEARWFGQKGRLPDRQLFSFEIHVVKSPIYMIK